MATTYKAMIIEDKNGEFTRRIGERTIEELPGNDLLIRVHHSSLNYKDALSAVGNKGVTRTFPHTPGIDAVGEVVEDASNTFKTGDTVIVTGFDLGMNTWGGFGQYIRVPAEWALPLPNGLTETESMAFGTAGFTAGLSVYRLEQAGVLPDSGDVLVTGSTGGVGSIAVGILAKAGYSVTAVTGSMENESWLKEMGASAVMSRDDVTANADKAMGRETWAGAVDVVGGDILTAALKTTKYGGSVTACGLVGSPGLEKLNVFPFILRGVSLLGVDSVQCPVPTRQEIWKRLGNDWKPTQLASLTKHASLEETDALIDDILKGKTRGRIVVDHD